MDHVGQPGQDAAARGLDGISATVTFPALRPRTAIRNDTGVLYSIDVCFVNESFAQVSSKESVTTMKPFDVPSWRGVST
jgi:hypothetical protein